jgi:hypothetical protein
MLKSLYKKRWIKTLVIFVAVFAGILIVAAISVNAYWSPVLGDKLKSTIYKATDSLYRVDFTKMRLNVLSGKITIDDIILKPDTVLYNELKLNNKAENNLYELKIKRLVLDGIQSWTLYRERKLIIGSITLTQPEMKINYENLKNEDSEPKETRSIYERIKDDLQSIQVKRIDLHDVNFNYTDLSGKQPRVVAFKELDLHASNLKIDSATQADQSRFLFCEDVSARLQNYQALFLDELYTYQFKSLYMSTATRRLELYGLSIKPNLSDRKFAAKFNVQTDRYDLAFDTVRLDNFDLKAMNKYRHLRTSNLHIINGNLNVFLDRNLPKPDIDKSENYPHNALKRLNMDVIADTVTFKNVNIGYTELNPKNQQKGKITFKKLGGNITNVTTNPSKLKENNIANANLTAYLMGYGKMDVNIRFNLTANDGQFTYKGSLGAMDLKHMNAVAQPLGMVKINSGTVKSLNFNVSGNNSGSKGTVDFLYNNLKISILKVDDNEMVKKQGLISMLANVLIIKDANPENPGEKAHSSNVVFERPRRASFFNLMWKTVFLGVKDAVGLSLNVEEDMKKKAQSIEKNKTERELKREERRKRRLQRNSN